MKKEKIKKAFTLIELLVVITIIGILAVGGTLIYTQQISKANDASRSKDIMSLKTGLESLYSNLKRYPGEAAFSESQVCDTTSDDNNSSIKCLTTLNLLSTLPKDKKSGTVANGSPLDYLYNFSGSVILGSGSLYELSYGVESGLSTGNATGDSGSDKNRVEVYNGKGTDVSTCANGTSACSANDSSATVIPNTTNSGSRLKTGDIVSPIIIK